jgi:dCMP deaminase
MKQSVAEFIASRDRWDRHFLDLALRHASMSKDPSTKVGCVVIGPDREPLSNGFNGFPRGIYDSEERLNDREQKLELVVHGEMNCICNAARSGISLKGGTLYVTATDKSGAIWGGPPCCRCAVHVIQVGIIAVVSFPIKSAPSRWHADLVRSHELLSEAGVSFREVPL